MGGHPIGRQPFRPGQWSRYQGGGSINIYHKEVHNNYGGAMFPMMNYGMYGNYGYYNPGLTSGEKWMLALGGIGAIGGAILSAFTGGQEKIEGTPPASDDGKAEIQAQQEANEALEEQIKELREKNADLKAQLLKQKNDEIQKMKELSGQIYNPDAEEVKTEETTTYTIDKSEYLGNGQYKGETGYGIVKYMYKGPNGEELSHDEIMAIAKKIFGGKAIAPGNIELKNTITLDNGKTYSIRAENERPDEKIKSEYSLKEHQVYEGTAKQYGGYWVATINGEPLKENGQIKQFSSEEDAENYAKDAAAKKQAAGQQDE